MALDGSLWRFKGQGGRTISSGKEERVGGGQGGRQEGISSSIDLHGKQQRSHTKHGDRKDVYSWKSRNSYTIIRSEGRG